MLDLRQHWDRAVAVVGARIGGRTSGSASSTRGTDMTDELSAYVLETWVDEPPAGADLRAATQPLARRGMQIGTDQGRVLHWLVRTLGATRTIEVGVFTGYSTMWTALALPDDGEVIACDVSEEWTSIGRPHWEAAGVADKIDLRLAPAADTLQSLIDDGRAGAFDFAFIDADKSNYDTYYELCLQLVRDGGVIAIDNVLWGGSVVDPMRTDADTEAIRAINAKVGSDDRVDACLLSIGDGVTLATKKP